jgi:uncharacterized protein with HEPN domain
MLEKDIANIHECLHAINSIQKYTEEFNQLDDLLNDNKTYDAVLMNFIVLGEAANRISDALKTNNPQIPWKEINGFRNFVAHDYFGVDENIVWAAIQIHISELKKELEKILLYG